ncbi:uncharacterized protein MONBRDRAFT_23784 [Monosiga brevicollis MX1]|uniref:C2H2-type domain-containing protein n=1 Tax=Monosiga brevicollis TaxID=81824 RepID=A9UUU0_MONBE|nr:uncharacterized protein MONBRDRAFT_23784 [Monosiga brevicollis MX1]EDQ90778.1 predicted protein [Monosiga brevicollis MX1]|eukprot:XP_001744075.1 hypothetical protein [Monosiga brevicollis MX1]
MASLFTSLTMMLEDADRRAAHAMEEAERQARRRKIKDRALAGNPLSSGESGDDEESQQPHEEPDASAAEPTHGSTAQGEAQRTPSTTAPTLNLDSPESPARSKSVTADDSRELAGLRAENEMLQRELRALEAEIATSESRHAASQNTIGDLRRQLEQTEQRMKDLRRQRHDGDQSTEQLRADLRHAQDEIEQMRNQLQTAERSYEHLRRSMRSQEDAHRVAVDSFNSEIAHLQHKLEQSQAPANQTDLNSEASTDAPAASSLLQQAQQELEARVQELEQELQQTRGQLVAAQRQQQASQAELAEAQREFDDYKTKAQRILQAKEKQLQERTADNSMLDMSSALTQSSLNREEELRRLRDELHEAEAMRLEYERTIEELQQQQETDADMASQHFQDLEAALATSRLELGAATEQFERRVRALEQERDTLIREKQQHQSQVQELEGALDQHRTRLREAAATEHQATMASEAGSHVAELTRQLVAKQGQLEELRKDLSMARLEVDEERRKAQMATKLAQDRAANMAQWEETMQMEPLMQRDMLRNAHVSEMERRLQSAVSHLDAMRCVCVCVCARALSLSLFLDLHLRDKHTFGNLHE